MPYAPRSRARCAPTRRHHRRPDPALDETVAREAADALEAAVARASAPDSGPSVRGEACTIVRRARRRADEAVDVVDLTSRALGDGDEEAARRRNAADAERLAGAGLDDDETDDAEAETAGVSDDNQGGR